jgi:signal transduction histidine kinase
MNTPLALRPSMLNHYDLVAALRRGVRQVTLGTGLDLQYHVSGSPGAMDSEAAMHLLRIAQEAATNAVKYAHAQHLTVDLTATGELICFCVADDGRGFEVEAAEAAGGLGLRSMRERAVALGAELTITSAPDHGTTVSVSVPR